MKGQWIRTPVPTGSAAATFQKNVKIGKKIKKATLSVSSIGNYRAEINGIRVGRQVLTPGFTSYPKRVQYQTYDVTELLTGENNTVAVTVAPGWAVGHIGYVGGEHVFADHIAAIAELKVTFENGKTQSFVTGTDWEVYTSEVTFSDIYNGETVDKTVVPEHLGKAAAEDRRWHLIRQVGADILEQEHMAPVSLIVTPKGERVIDFGQNMTGYVTVHVKGNRGERIVFSHAETLDRDGNFYNANYRKAKNIVTYVLDGEEDFFKPLFSFQGFRYIRLDEYPDREIDLSAFCAVVVHSDMERTGYFTCGNDKINQLYHNIIWGQKSNYLDIPTDCPQRDERLGWTGDAQVFCRTAATNYDVRKFFEKWLGDLRAEQLPSGAIYGTCPESYGVPGSHSRFATGWGDAATIIPWTVYELYGDEKFLRDNFNMMCRWVEYMHATGPEEYLWLTGYHYGDWLAMDGDTDTCLGATSTDLIASAFFAYSTELVVRAGDILGIDVEKYRTLYANIRKRFRSYFLTENGIPKAELPLTEIKPRSTKSTVDVGRKGVTQTSLTLILAFGLCEESERKTLTDLLVQKIQNFGWKMTTGFLGTPYLLHVLSQNGRTDVAYRLFFNEETPSWLYSVNHGATTMWEHWNSLKEDGTFWSTSMNSFNHYAYGAVGDWIYGVVCGIRIDRDGVGYRKITLRPVPDRRLGFADCTIKTVSGTIGSRWYYRGDQIYFEFTVPQKTQAELTLPDGTRATLSGGTYHYTIPAV